MTTTNSTTCELREKIEGLHSALNGTVRSFLFSATLLDEIKGQKDDLDISSAAYGVYGTMSVIADYLGEILDHDDDAESEPDSFDDEPEEKAGDDGISLLLAEMNLTKYQRRFVERLLKNLR